MSEHPDARDHVVVMAGSAGGIPAMRTILGDLPSDFPAPIVVLQHRTPGRPGMLAKVLGAATTLRVKDIEEGERLVAGTVYVAPADRHAFITPDRRLQTHDHAKINFVRSSADPLFRSAAEVYGAGAIGVVLSGGGRNGVGGAKAVRDAGGEVIAQNRATAQLFGMPHAAIEAGAATAVLPLGQIAGRLESIV